MVVTSEALNLHVWSKTNQRIKDDAYVSFSSPYGGTKGEVCRLLLHVVVLLFVSDLYCPCCVTIDDDNSKHSLENTSLRSGFPCDCYKK